MITAEVRAAAEAVAATAPALTAAQKDILRVLLRGAVLMPYNDERRPGGSGALVSSGDSSQGTNTVRQMAGGEPIGWPPPPCPCSICLGFADPVQPQQRRSGTAWCHRCRSRHLRTDPFCVARRAGGAA